MAENSELRMQRWVISALCLVVTGFAGVIWANLLSDRTTLAAELVKTKQAVSENQNRLVALETRLPDLKASIERIEAKLNVLEMLIRYRNTVQPP